VTTILTSASLHDSQVAIPMMKMTSKKITCFYDLMDAAYDARQIYEVSRSLDHVPIIDKNPRRGEALPFSPAEARRYNERTVAERVNGRLKEEFGGKNRNGTGAQEGHTSSHVRDHRAFCRSVITACTINANITHLLASP
jgi:hypothetical protein